MKALVQPARHAGDDDCKHDALNKQAHGAMAGTSLGLHGTALGPGLAADLLIGGGQYIAQGDAASQVFRRSGGDDAFQMLDATTHFLGFIKSRRGALALGGEVLDVGIAGEGLSGADGTGLAADVRSHNGRELGFRT